MTAHLRDIITSDGGGEPGWLCFRSHPCPSHLMFFEPMRHRTLGDFMVCQIVNHRVALAWALASGFLWAKAEGDLLRWRWQFWRPSLHRWVLMQLEEV